MEQRKTRDGKNYPRPTRITLRSSDNVVVARRKLFTERNFSKKSRAFLTHLASVPQALKGTKIVPLGELANSLGVDVKRILPALEHGYLKLVTADPPAVYEPPPAAMDWLRVMYQPLTLRPFLSSAMVGELEGITAFAVRRLCLDYNIPIYSDPVFGELMSISAYYRFHQQMHSQRDPSRFDRQGMLWAMMHTVAPDEWRRDVKPPRFSRRIELEVRRIAALQEPARTDAALRLWTAWSDTQKVWSSIAAAQGRKYDPTPKALKRLEKMLAVEMPTDTVHKDEGVAQHP